MLQNCNVYIATNCNIYIAIFDTDTAAHNTAIEGTITKRII